MGAKGSKLYGIFKMKCPKCHNGDLFEDKNPYHLSKIFDMPDKCPHCEQKFMVEPGFYFGAMYVGYGISIAYLVSVYVAMSVLYPTFSVTEYLIVAITSLIILTPYFFRLSRSIWIHLFVKYDKNSSKKEK